MESGPFFVVKGLYEVLTVRTEEFLVTVAGYGDAIGPIGKSIDVECILVTMLIAIFPSRESQVSDLTRIKRLVRAGRLSQQDPIFHLP